MLFLKKNEKINSTNYAYDYKSNQVIQLEDLFSHEIVVNGVIIEANINHIFSGKSKKNKINLEDDFDINNDKINQ